MIFGLGLEKSGTNPPVMKRAFELGVRFFDTAPTYGSGLGESLFGEAIKASGVQRNEIIISTKTHERDPQGALTLLDRSLRYLDVDYIDIWHLHDLTTPFDLKVTPALDKAKKDGKVRYVGVTCNRDPAVLKEVIKSYTFDYIMMSMNIADRHRLSFIDTVLPHIDRSKTKLIAMQVFMRGMSRYPIHAYVRNMIEAEKHLCPTDLLQMNLIPTNTTPLSGRWTCPKCGYQEEELPEAFRGLQDCMDYVASYNPDVMLIGVSNLSQLERDLTLFKNISSMAEGKKRELEQKTLPSAELLNFYKAAYVKPV